MADRRRTSEVVDDEEPELLAEDTPELADEDTPELADEDAPDADGARRAGGARRRPARPARRAQSGLTARESAEAALRQIAELTAKQIEGVTGVERTEEGWLIGVEVVEDRRIPSSADILATYEAAIDADGELLSYRRVRRYPRGRGTEGRES
jgi:hypothetical protein